MRNYRSLLFLFSLLFLAACGQKGALYIPAEPPENQQQQQQNQQPVEQESEPEQEQP